MTAPKHFTRPSKPPDTVSMGWIDKVHLLPSDREAERKMLSILLDYALTIFETRAMLGDGEVFYHTEHASVYQAILTVYDRGEPVNLFSVMTELRRTGLGSVIDSANLEELGYSTEIGTLSGNIATYLRELYIQRLLATASGKLFNSVVSREPFEEQLTLTQQLGDMLSEKMNLAAEKKLSHWTSLCLANIHLASETSDGLIGVTTGLERINRLFGGWQPKKMHLIGARPGAGKTAVGLFHAKKAAAAGTPTAFKSTEMPVEEMVLRLISSECDITYQELAGGRYDDGTPFSAQDWDAIHKAAGYIESLPLYFYADASDDINDFVVWCMDLIRRKGVGILFLDYVQMMTDRTVRSTDKKDQVGSASSKLKKLANAGNVPVVVMSQLSREIEKRENKRPLLTDLRETGQLEQDADVVIGLYRDDYYKLERAKANMVNNKPEQPEFDNTLEYDLLKRRGGKLRMARIGIWIGTNQLVDRPPVSRESGPKTAPVPSEVRDDNWIATFPKDAVGAGFAPQNQLPPGRQEFKTPSPPGETPF